MLPTILLVPFWDWRWPVVCFAIIVLMAGVLESASVTVATTIGERSVADPLAIRVASMVGLLLLAVFWAAQIESSIHDWQQIQVQIIGGCLMTCGVVLRIVAIRTLGNAFVTDIRCNQSIVHHGIYRWLRHPSEVGMLLMAFGAPVLLLAPLTACFAIVALGSVSTWRIRRENRVLEPIRSTCHS